MFGKTVGSVLAVSCLCSLLFAGQAIVYPGRNLRSGSLSVNTGENTGLGRSWLQRPVWPPNAGIGQKPGVRAAELARDGFFGEVFMVDTGVVPVPASGFQWSFGAASDGSSWRVILADENDHSVRTSGIDPYGSLFDPEGKLFGHYENAVNGQMRSLVRSGSGFVAVWAKSDTGIWAAILDAAGGSIGSFRVYGGGSSQSEPTVAFDGDSTCLVVWTEGLNGSNKVCAARVTTGGRVLDAEPIRLVPSGKTTEGSPAVAFGRGVYLTAWTATDSATRDVTTRAVRVSTDGIVLDTAVFLRHDPAMIQAYPSLAFGDSCFLAAWSEGLDQPDIYAARVSTSGLPIDTTGVQLCSGPNNDILASIGFDGTRFLVMWCELDLESYASCVRGRRITAGGVPLDTGLIRPELPGYVCTYPSVAGGRTDFLVAFTAGNAEATGGGVCCMRIGSDGAVLDSGIFLPMPADAQKSPKGASDGTGFLAAWLESRTTGTAVSAARITGDGIVLDSIGFNVCKAVGPKDGLAVGFGDSLYLLAWTDTRGDSDADIYCARVTRNGQVLDPSGFVVCGDSMPQRQPDVGFDGQNFLVAWQDFRQNRVRSNIYAARVSPSGVVLDPNGFAVAPADTVDDAAPAVCFLGTDYLAVWQGYNFVQGSTRVQGALVSPNGTAGPRFLVGRPAGLEQLEPCVARGPAISLVAWSDLRNRRCIYAARVSDDGTVLDPDGVLVDSTRFEDESPLVAAVEDGFKLLWTRREGDRTKWIVAAQMDTSGYVTRKGDWFALPDSVVGYDAMYGSGPDLMLLFSGWTDTAYGRYFGAERVWGKVGTALGIQSDTRQLPAVARTASIVRGVLFLPRDVTGLRSGTRGSALLDLAGRRVLDLRPGPNDVRSLAPGVYFVRAVGHETSAANCTKVVITR